MTSLLNKMCRIGLIFLSYFCGKRPHSVTGQNLKFVLVVFRHGDRTPIHTYPNDLYKEDSWPQGYGQLTKLGMQQQFQLGESLRKRYSTFLSPEYNRREIYIRSTDIDRTIMSAQANLAGFFPPSTTEMFSSKIQWQPIPVHTVPESDEKLLTYPQKNCKRFLQLLQETMKKEEVQNKIKSNMKLLTSLAINTGYDVKTLLNTDGKALYSVFDALYVEKIHGRKLPPWATSSTLTQMGQVLAYGLSAIFGVHAAKEKSRLQGGVLVKDILQKMTEASQSGPKKKMIMYSAHDTTIVALQSALNVLSGIVKYAACYYFELYQESNGQHTVKMFFQNGPDKSIDPVTLPGCTESCPLDKFTQLVSPIIPDNWDKECNN